MRALTPVLMAAFLGPACVTPPEAPSGDGWKVKVVHAPPADGCTALETVALETAAESGGLVAPGSSRLRTDRAERHLRDLAAGVGADTLLVHPPQLQRATSEDGTDTLVLTGVAYRCDDAVVTVASGAPVPEGAALATATRWTVVRRGPDRSAPALAHLAPGARVIVLEAAGLTGFRHVRAEDGSPLGYVEEAALEPVR